MIIGVTGTLGAGKGTVVEYLVKVWGFTHFSARDFCNEEIARRGLVSNRDVMTQVANELRAQHGPDYFAKESLRRAKEKGGDVVIESIRSIGEARHLKDNGALLWAVDADRKLRYERVVLRATAFDKISFEKFIADEEREFANTDPTMQNISGVMTMADKVFQNNGTKEELFAQVEGALQLRLRETRTGQKFI